MLNQTDTESTVELTEDIKKKISDYVLNDLDKIITVDFDRSEQVSKNDIKKYFTNDDIVTGEGVSQYFDKIYDLNLDYIDSLEDSYVQEIMDLFHLENEPEIQSEVCEICRDADMHVDLNLDKLLENTEITLRLDLYSNYDCINSHYFENGYRYNSYFGDILKVLKINPQALKKYIKDNDYFEMVGSYPNLKSRDKYHAVDYKEFATEIINSCSPANLFTFVISTNLLDACKLIKKAAKGKYITIKEGTLCGLFSSMNGGGSLLELEIKEDLKTTINKGKYDYLGFVIDGTDGYSIEETYGISKDYYSDGGFQID